MVLKQFFKLAFINLSHRRTRSFLTIIGIFIGIAAVVSLISLGSGLQETVSGEFERVGADKIMITPGQAVMGPMSAGFSSAQLTEADAKNVRQVRGVKLVAPLIEKTSLVTLGDKSVSAFIAGVPLDETRIVIEEFMDVKAAEGRLLASKDKYKILVGYNFWSDDPLGREVRLGDKLEINGFSFQVVGLLEKVGDPSSDGGLVMSLDDAKTVFNTESYYMLAVKVNRGEKPSEIVPAIEKKLRRTRNVKEGKEDFSVKTTEQLVESFNLILGVVQAIVVGIAAISLLVGGIGIMNTMYTSVVERTREIGIMKAIGAKNRDIMLLFLIESGMLGLAGGIVGVLIGFLLTKIAEALVASALGLGVFKPNLTTDLIVGALLFSFIIGTVSGVLPARQASRLQPVDALRFE